MLRKLRRKLIKIRRSNFSVKILKITFSIAGKLPVKPYTIVFESFSGKQYSDNPKALFHYIEANYPEYQLYWSFDRNNVTDLRQPELNVLPRFGIKWIIVMARAKFWITNSRLPLWIPKPGHTTYIQTWHGTPLKKLGLDMDQVLMPGTNTETYKRNFFFEVQKWDYLISPNRYSTEIFKRAFGFQKKVLETGYPRNDALSNNNTVSYINNLKQAFNIPKDKKVILYAPTWRDNEFYKAGKYKFSLKFDLDEMKRVLSKDFVLLIRMHYLVSEHLNLEKYEDFVYDVSQYSDVSDLYLMSDVLITDYSSVFFDYANLKRPILFYTYDLDTYRDTIRGFYFDFENEAPGPIVKTTEEILHYLRMIRDDEYRYPSNFNQFYEQFCYLEDGNASHRITLSLFEKERKG